MNKLRRMDWLFFFCCSVQCPLEQKKNGKNNNFYAENRNQVWIGWRFFFEYVFVSQLYMSGLILSFQLNANPFIDFDIVIFISLPRHLKWMNNGITYTHERARAHTDAFDSDER